MFRWRWDVHSPPEPYTRLYFFPFEIKAAKIRSKGKYIFFRSEDTSALFVCEYRVKILLQWSPMVVEIQSKLPWGKCNVSVGRCNNRGIILFGLFPRLSHQGQSQNWISAFWRRWTFFISVVRIDRLCQYKFTCFGTPLIIFHHDILCVIGYLFICVH